MDGPALTLNGRPRIRGGGALCARGRVTRSLVLWSGGLDSTYALLRLLRESDDAVFSHHVRIDRGARAAAAARRADCEAAAVQRLLAPLQEAARPFHHGTSRVDLRGLGGAACAITGDAALLGFLAAHATMAHGFTPFDRVLVGVNGDADPGWQPDTAACALRRARLARALRAAWGCDEVPLIYLWEPRPTKAAMRDYLGDAIASRTVSCLRPRPAGEGDAVLVPCGECAKCAWDARRPPTSAIPASAAGRGAAAGTGLDTGPAGDAASRAPAGHRACGPAPAGAASRARSGAGGAVDPGESSSARGGEPSPGSTAASSPPCASGSSPARVSGSPPARVGDSSPARVSATPPGGAAAPSPPPFRRLVSALSRTRAHGDPAEASDPPAP